MKKFFLRAAALLLALVLAGCGTASPAETVPTEADKTDDNYRVFYEIFVGSFADSDGDGTGDLNGILRHLDYLNDGNLLSDTSLGVQGLWLTPIFASPSYHKYDATDYYRIDSDFGTEDDLRALLDACHARNVKVILDLVINHTARNHEWFQSFCQSHADANPDDPYYDYYSWYTGETLPAGITCEKIPGTADEYYECNFSPDMPELNYDNPAVREEMLNVAKYYLELGVDGFRFDAVKYLYYGETGRNAAFWKWYTDQLRAVKPEVYLVGECWSGESEILAYYPAMNCFNFAAAQAEGVIASAAKDQDINRFTGYMCAFQDKISQANPDGMMICFLSNHDMDRSAGYLMLANHFPQMAANLYLLCSGSPFLYYGEEIGMKGVRACHALGRRQQSPGSGGQHLSLFQADQRNRRVSAGTGGEPAALLLPPDLYKKPLPGNSPGHLYTGESWQRQVRRLSRGIRGKHPVYSSQHQHGHSLYGRSCRYGHSLPLHSGGHRHGRSVSGRHRPEPCPPDLPDPRLRRPLTAIAIQNRSAYHRHRKSPPAVPKKSAQPGEIKHVFFSRARGASWCANA